MSNREAEIVDCIVTNRLTQGPAFAVREDNGEAVFVGTSQATLHDLRSFDQIQAVLVRNRKEPDRTPWFSVRARVVERAEELEE